MGDKKESKKLMVRFLVVKDLTAYNVILGRPTLSVCKVVIVPHLMLMKFECDSGSVGSLHGDQLLARECYYLNMKAVSGKSEGDAPEPPQVGEKRRQRVKHEVMAIAEP